MTAKLTPEIADALPEPEQFFQVFRCFGARADQQPRVRRDPELNQALAAYRAQFDRRVLQDLDTNLDQLRAWSEHPGVRQARLVQALFEQLQASRRILSENDPWRTSRQELLCWNGFHQFYCDALCLAETLLRQQHGRPCTRFGLKRHEQIGASSYRWSQALINKIEQGIPDIFFFSPLRGLLPILVYQGTRSLLPRPPWRVLEYGDKARRVVTSGALSHYAGTTRPVTRRYGIDAFMDDPYFFDLRTRRTRHNIIFAVSHRHSFFDLGLTCEVLHGTPFASWSNIQYFPKSAATDPLIITVHPGESRRLDAAMQRSAELGIDRGYPILSYVDGGAPYLLYGQQMRIKPGIRMLVDHLADRSAGTSRRTYIVPVSLNDTVSLLRRQQQEIKVTAHSPICSADIAAPPQRPDRSAVNRGDPLLVHLEALFLANTAQVHFGWQTPEVVEATRRFRSARSHPRSLRDCWRAPFHASIYDLAVDSARRGRR